jgi:hypothetical protein
MNDFSEACPYTRIAETTAVRIPSGATPKIILSRKLVDSLRNCFVTCSPKRVISGARSVAKLLVNSLHCAPGSAATSMARERIEKA